MNDDWDPPTWWRTADQQLERASQLWPDSHLPELPNNLTACGWQRIPLLHVPDSFESLWDKVCVPADGYIKNGLRRMQGKGKLRRAPNKVEYDRPVWLKFDYSGFLANESPVDLWAQNANLAASEVLSALIQFPEWSLTWLNGKSPAPILSGYQVFDGEDWSQVPCVSLSNLRTGNNIGSLSLSLFPADYADVLWASHLVKEY